MEPNHGERPPYPSDETVIDQLRRNVQRTPAAIALVVPEGDADNQSRLELSYEEMWVTIGRVAQQIAAARSHGGSGHWVMLVLPQGLQQVVAVWGTLLSGCGYVPIDADTQAARLRILFEETHPCLAIGEAPQPCQPRTQLAVVAEEFGVALGTFVGGARAGLGVVGRATSHKAAPPSAKAPPSANEALQPRLDAPALLLFSSGSTGTPKGIVYDHAWLMGGSYFVGRDLGLSPRSRCLLRCSYVWSVSL